MNEGYYFAEVQPAYERVFIGHDKVTRMQDRHGQFLEFTGQELQLIVAFAVENRDVIIANPETRFALPIADNYGQDVQLLGDEIDAIMRRLGEVEIEPETPDYSSQYNF